MRKVLIFVYKQDPRTSIQQEQVKNVELTWNKIVLVRRKRAWEGAGTKNK